MPSLFPAATNAALDQSYPLDFVYVVNIAASGSSGLLQLKRNDDIYKIRQIIVTDVTAAKGGTQAPLIACSVQLDTALGGSAQRIVKPNGFITIMRQCAGVTINNANTGAIWVMVELGS